MIQTFIISEVDSIMPTGRCGFNEVSSLSEPVLLLLLGQPKVAHVGEFNLHLFMLVDACTLIRCSFHAFEYFGGATLRRSCMKTQNGDLQAGTPCWRPSMKPEGRELHWVSETELSPSLVSCRGCWGYHRGLLPGRRQRGGSGGVFLRRKPLMHGVVREPSPGRARLFDCG